MDTINNDLTNLLKQMGVHQESLGITQRIVIIAGILIIAFVADYFCRKIVVPTIKKLTARTQATWDDYLFNDAVLDNMCHLIPPIILYVLLPFAFPHEPCLLYTSDAADERSSHEVDLFFSDFSLYHFKRT